MSAKRRMKKMKRQRHTANRSTRQPTPVLLSRPPLVNDKIVFTDSSGAIEYLKSWLMENDPMIIDTLCYSDGVAIKVYDDRHMEVLAPDYLEDDPSFGERLNEIMIDKFCGRQRFDRTYEEHGPLAAINLVRDVELVIDFYS